MDLAIEQTFRQESSKKIIDTVKIFAKSNIPILLSGETGTGKEIIARVYHQNSLYKKGPFIAINCAAIPETIAEALFFGSVPGAFTGANKIMQGYFKQAHKGVLFLDELTDLPYSLQSKLLRVLEDKSCTPLGAHHIEECDFQLISATCKPIRKEITENRFRLDLFYRLCAYEVELEPLRHRTQDFDWIIHYLIKDKNKSLDNKALQYLKSYYWPGNIRQLKNSLELACILAKNQNKISLKDIHILDVQTQTQLNNVHQKNVSILEMLEKNYRNLPTLEELKNEYIENINLKYTNKDVAAGILGISTRNFKKEIEKIIPQETH